MNILNENIGLLRSKILKLLRQTKGNSRNNYDALKFVISVMGGYCDFWPRAKKSYVTDLCNNGFVTL
jgi:hypothetical protein